MHKKREIERYFFDKKEKLLSLPEEVKNFSFDYFKKWINNEINDKYLTDFSKALVQEKCGELNFLEKFFIENSVPGKGFT